MRNLSYENEFYLHVNENSFSHERLCTKTRFEKGEQNSKMAYAVFWFFQDYSKQCRYYFMVNVFCMSMH